GQGATGGRDDVNLQRHQFSRECEEPFGLPLGIAVCDQEVAALDVAEVTQSLAEGLAETGIAGRQVESQIANPWYLRRLLRWGGERHCEQAQHERDEGSDDPVPHGRFLLSVRCRSSFHCCRTLALSRCRKLKRSVSCRQSAAAV